MHEGDYLLQAGGVCITCSMNEGSTVPEGLPVVCMRGHPAIYMRGST